MRCFLTGLVLIFGLVSYYAFADTNQLQSVMLWSNNVLSAKFLFLPKASLADKGCMALEFDNTSGHALDVLQAFLNLDGDRIDLATGKQVSSGGITCGVVCNGQLPQGKTTISGYVFKCAGATLGLPPVDGLRVNAIARVDVRLTDNRDFATPRQGINFSFNWLYPDTAGIESMKAEFKELLAHPDNQFASGYRLDALVLVPGVSDVVSRDELLSALKSRSWVDGKDAVMTIVGKRFPNDPGFIAYFVDQLSRLDGDAFFSFPREVWQNPALLEPLVGRYEKFGDGAMELLQIRTEWFTDRQVVIRLSAALMKRHSVLNRNVNELSSADLCDWSDGVKDAGIIGNPDFLRWLNPALDDKRVIPDRISKLDSRPRMPWTPRVCDCASEAILMILDGNSWSAFQKAGIQGWRTQAQYYAAHDRIIADLKKRMDLADEKTAKI